MIIVRSTIGLVTDKKSYLLLLIVVIKEALPKVKIHDLDKEVGRASGCSEPGGLKYAFVGQVHVALLAVEDPDTTHVLPEETAHDGDTFLTRGCLQIGLINELINFHVGFYDTF